MEEYNKILFYSVEFVCVLFDILYFLVLFLFSFLVVFVVMIFISCLFFVYYLDFVFFWVLKFLERKFGMFLLMGFKRKILGIVFEFSLYYLR